MSDLQCPVTVLLVPREVLASPERARALAERRLSGVFVDAAVAQDPQALASVRSLADAAARSPVEVLGALDDATKLTRALDELADAYRGETVAVVTTSAVIQSKLNHARPPADPIAVAIDSSGLVVIAPEAADTP